MILLAIVSMAVVWMSVAALLTFETVPTDVRTAIRILLGILAPLMVVMLALLIRQAAREIHRQFNSRMDEFLKQARSSGVLEGRQLERDATQTHPLKEPDDG